MKAALRFSRIFAVLCGLYFISDGYACAEESINIDAMVNGDIQALRVL